MAKYVSCTKDVAKSHITGGKRYKITREDKDSFSFIADNGTNRFCLKEDCAHLFGADGAEWVFHNEADEVSDMKYKVGDKVRVVKALHDKHRAHEFEIGSVVTVDRIDEEDTDLKYCCTYLDDFWWVSEEEIEPADHNKTADIASLTLDNPTEAMKEFADHCERAAAALERIKAALA